MAHRRRDVQADLARDGRHRARPLRPVGVHVRWIRHEIEASGPFHHLFDPLTGTSAHGYLAVSVLATNTMIADALSTALYVTPPQRSSALLASFPGVSALATLPDGSVRHLRGDG
jgi:thiamine biosynthesis lipoprotein ApbE